MKKLILLVLIGTYNYTFAQDHKILKVISIKEYSTIHLIKGIAKNNDTTVLAVIKDCSFILKKGSLYEFSIRSTPIQTNLTITQDEKILWRPGDPLKSFPYTADFLKEVTAYE
ncbi:MAG: hypothetical protein ABI315_15975 [Bacteroidia bacterium]